MNDRDLADRFELALTAVRKASYATLRHFDLARTGLEVERKANGTPVTIADRECEESIRAAIRHAFPRDSILGEELPSVTGDSPFRWIIDPIDGTKSFIRGVPLWGTLVGVDYLGKNVIGVVVMPAVNEMIYASPGKGAWLVRGHSAPTPARVSTTATLKDALVCITSASAFAHQGARAFHDRLVDSAAMFRGWSDCYGAALVATGRADAMIEPRVSVWDVAYLPVIMQEAGGKFTDWNGSRSTETGHAIISNGMLHDELLRTLSASRTHPGAP